MNDPRGNTLAWYCRGRGLEIGPGEHPLPLEGRELMYFDMPGAETSIFKRHTLAGVPIVEGDAETLDGVPGESFDFVASSHVLEHCKRPISTLRNWCRVLRPRGILWIAVPLKDECFDRDRPTVTLQHLQADEVFFEPEPHYREYISKVDKLQGAELEARIQECVEAADNIHFHAWDGRAWTELFCYIWKLGWAKIEEQVVNGHEVIFVLRKP